MAQQPPTLASSLATTSISSAANSSANSSATGTGPTLYPPIEPPTVPLEESEKYLQILKIEKELVGFLKTNALAESSGGKDPLTDVADSSILPTELMSNSKKISKSKLDPLKRLKELPAEEVEEEEEEDEEEEDEDEEQQVVEDEEADAGGDYLVSHFDNGEGYEDNDDEGDDMASTI